MAFRPGPGQRNLAPRRQHAYTRRSARKDSGEFAVDLERLWAPWRLGYIVGDDAPPPPLEPTSWRPGAKRDCFVCRAAASFADPAGADHRHLVVARRDDALALLNLYPYNNGHLLVCPPRHVAELADLTPAERLAAMDLLTEYVGRYRELLKAEGFNIGLNLGRIAGAGVPGHLHWHLVPRWSGDSNFMGVTAATRVIPQSLEELWQALAADEQA